MSFGGSRVTHMSAFQAAELKNPCHSNKQQRRASQGLAAITGRQVCWCAGVQACMCHCFSAGRRKDGVKSFGEFVECCRVKPRHCC